MPDDLHGRSEPLTADSAHNRLICPLGHAFDIARQGYVSLLHGPAQRLRSDTADMVAARRRVHDAGALAAVTTAVADAVVDAAAADPPTHRAPSRLLDIGAGTGHYLAAALDRVPDAYGLGVDLSKYCARAVARCHPRAASVVADIWSGLPVASSSIDAMLCVFAPRNADEFARVLRTSGRLLVVTPQPGHLAELVTPMRMLEVGADKAAKLDDELATDFDRVQEQSVTDILDAPRALIADLVAMGPSAFHRSTDQIAAAADALVGARDTVAVTVSVRVSQYRRR